MDEQNQSKKNQSDSINSSNHKISKSDFDYNEINQFIQSKKSQNKLLQRLLQKLNTYHINK